jgi:hypothetical protein
MEEQYIPEGAESTLAEGEQSQPNPAEVTPGPEQSGQQPVPAAFDPKGFEYKYKGQAYYPKDRNHLTNLMAKGHSYESSMAQIKQEQTRIQQEQQKFQQMGERYRPYEQMDQMFKNNPQFKQELMALSQKYQQQGQPQGGIPPELQEKIHGFEQFQNQFIQQQENDKLDKAINDAKQKYQAYDWATDDGEGNLETKVLRFMDESKIYDFDKGFRAFAFDMAQNRAQATALTQAAQAQQQRHRAGVVDGGAPSVTATPRPAPNPARQSYSQLANQAKAELAGR